jgi:hypothetical protein
MSAVANMRTTLQNPNNNDQFVTVLLRRDLCMVLLTTL